MRIVVHGQQAFGKAVLEKLLDRDENIVAVCTAPDKEGRPIDPLKELALENSLSVHQPESWKTDDSLKLMESFDADLCMMAYVLLFVPEAVLNSPKLGSFQYHPSLLPMHRGPSSINWPIALFHQIQRFDHSLNAHREQFFKIYIPKSFVRSDLTFFLYQNWAFIQPIVGPKYGQPGFGSSHCNWPVYR